MCLSIFRSINSEKHNLSGIGYKIIAEYYDGDFYTPYRGEKVIFERWNNNLYMGLDIIISKKPEDRYPTGYHIYKYEEDAIKIKKATSGIYTKDENTKQLVIVKVQYRYAHTFGIDPFSCKPVVIVAHEIYYEKPEQEQQQ